MQLLEAIKSVIKVLQRKELMLTRYEKVNRIICNLRVLDKNFPKFANIIINKIISIFHLIKFDNSKNKFT